LAFFEGKVLAIRRVEEGNEGIGEDWFAVFGFGRSEPRDFCSEIF
jgi:hypothetical protein